MKNKIVYISDIRSNRQNDKLGGHYVAVAQNYQDIFKDTTVLKVAGGPIYKKYFSKKELYLLPYDVSNTNIAGKIKTMVNAICLFRKAKGNIIVLQQSTILTSYLCILLFYWWTSKLYLIDYNTEAHNRLWKRMLYSLIKYKIDGIICPNERIGNVYDRPCCVVTDYIKTTSPNESLPFEERQYDFCMVGTIWPDKGVVEVARHLKGSGLKLIIAGAVPVSVRYLGEELERIASEDSNIKIILDYISEEEYKYIISHSKYCILNYQGGYNDRSSGVVLDVLFNETPIIGNKCGALELVEKFSVGYIYSDLKYWDPQYVLHEDIYNKYQSAIKKFFHKQKDYVLHLRKFVLN